MAPKASPRVEVELRAPRTCFLSSEDRFDFVLLLTLRNSEEPVKFLKDGLSGLEGFQSINSDRIVQCFDNDSDEQLQVLRQGTQPSYLKLEPNRCGYVTFTTSSTPRPYELAFVPSSLHPSKKYRLRFKSTTSITHWPSSTENALNPLSDGSSSLVSATDIPNPSTTNISWEVVGGDDNVVFETLLAPPMAPGVTVSVSAPSTMSLSRQSLFKFTLNFSTDAARPITVLAERDDVRSSNSDIEIIDPVSGSRLAPDRIDSGNMDGPWMRGEFLRIDGTYTEHREVDPTSLLWEGLAALKIGEEYVLRYLGGKWWWTEDTVDEVMTYAGERGGRGLGKVEAIDFTSPVEHRFKVVE